MKNQTKHEVDVNTFCWDSQATLLKDVHHRIPDLELNQINTDAIQNLSNFKNSTVGIVQQ